MQDIRGVLLGHLGNLVKGAVVKGRKWIVMLVIMLTLAGCFLFSTYFHAAIADDGKARIKTPSVRMGILKQVGSDYLIQSGRTTCRVTGRDFAPWLGKKVKVTGTMVRKDKHKVLEVSKIEEAKR